jgi:hypothetical protein
VEKATRVLTDEEKRILDQDWVGRDGSKRKVEVCFKIRDVCAVNYGATKAQEVVPI